MTLYSGPTPTKTVLPRSVLWRAKLAGLALMWERIWAALWPVTGFVGVFLIATFADLWRFVPSVLHILILGGLVVTGFISLRRNFSKVTWPTQDECLRRLEIKNNLPHHPLTSFQDKMAAVGSAEKPVDSGQEDLWRVYRARLRRSMRNLRISLPRSDLPRRDPFALRALILVGLVATFVLSEEDWQRRLAFAVQPGAADDLSNALMVDAWISPPSYTDQPPIFLTHKEASSGEQAGEQTNIEVPAGSQFVVRVAGAERQPTLSLRAHSPEAEPREIALEEVGPGSYEFTEELQEDVIAEITSGRQHRYSWQFTVKQDLPPVIVFSEELAATERMALRIPYALTDDYGVVGAQAEIRLETTQEMPSEIDGAASFDLESVPRTDSKPIILDLALPSLRTKKASGAFYEDLTAHPWAGLSVTVQLSAEDELGQRGQSEPVSFVLPEREFRNALARALVEQRKTLVLFPEETALVAKYLDAFAALPERYYEDLTVYLGLRTAFYRLEGIPDEQVIESVVQLLWDLAVRLEDGDTTMAAAAVRDLQRELMEALADNKPQDEIDKIMQALRQAIQRYMQALAKEGMKDMQRGDMPPSPGMGGQNMGQQDLDKLLKSLEDMLRSGNMDGAAQVMSQLMDMLENMEFGGFSQGGAQTNSPLGQALDELGDMIGRQRGLMDRTFREGQPEQGMPGGRSTPPSLEGLLRGDPFGRERFNNGRGQAPDDGSEQRSGSAGSEEGAGELAEEQQALGEQLRDIMRGLGQDGEIPNALERALRSMERSQQDLNSGDLPGSVEEQKRAIESMRQGAQSLAEALLNELERQGGRQNQEAGKRDPLGRPQAGGGPQTGNTVKVPEERDMQRARDILQELRRRAGELNRPAIELEYLDRLLKRF